MKKAKTAKTKLKTTQHAKNGLMRIMARLERKWKAKVGIAARVFSFIGEEMIKRRSWIPADDPFDWTVITIAGMQEVIWARSHEEGLSYSDAKLLLSWLDSEPVRDILWDFSQGETGSAAGFNCWNMYACRVDAIQLTGSLKESFPLWDHPPIGYYDGGVDFLRDNDWKYRPKNVLLWMRDKKKMHDDLEDFENND